MVIYLESSALVKLVIKEAESRALTQWLAERPDAAHLTSELGLVEVPRAIMRTQPESLLRAREAVQSVDTVPLTRELLEEAAALRPAQLRSLDAIHVATALRTRTLLTAVVSYNGRLLDAATASGLPVESPT